MIDIIILLGLGVVTLLQITAITLMYGHSDQHKQLENLIGYQRNYEAGLMELGKVPPGTMSAGTGSYSDEDDGKKEK